MENYNRPIQAMFTGQVREAVRWEGQKRGLGMSAMLRLIVNEWLRDNSTEWDVAYTAKQDLARSGPARTQAVDPDGTGAFLRERCVRHPDADVSRVELLTAWNDWRAARGLPARSMRALMADIRTEAPEVREWRPGADGASRPGRRWRGLGLLPA